MLLSTVPVGVSLGCASECFFPCCWCDAYVAARVQDKWACGVVVVEGWWQHLVASCRSSQVADSTIVATFKAARLCLAAWSPVARVCACGRDAPWLAVLSVVLSPVWMRHVAVLY